MSTTKAPQQKKAYRGWSIKTKINEAINYF